MKEVSAYIEASYDTEKLEKIYINGDGAAWIKSGQSKKGAKEAFEKILFVTQEEGKRKTVEASRDYILGNWAGIMQWVRDKNKEVKCSAEGHVSHIYADRMSSRPLGWSRRGADRMS